jgi:anti-sigma factor RsiW
MTSEFDAGNSSRQPFSTHLRMNGNSNIHQAKSELDNLKCNGSDRLQEAIAAPLRDRFELLSAYLDGEVTAAERRQVEVWLDQNAEVQCLYARLLKLRQGMRLLPIPTARQPIEQTVDRVLSRIEQRPRKALVWGGMAIAAMFLATWSDGLPGIQQHAVSNMAKAPEPIGMTDVSSDALMIALDRPVIEIPKAAVSVPDAAHRSLYEGHQDIR